MKYLVDFEGTWHRDVGARLDQIGAECFAAAVTYSPTSEPQTIHRHTVAVEAVDQPEAIRKVETALTPFSQHIEVVAAQPYH